MNDEPDRTRIVLADGLGVHSVVTKGTPSTVVVRAVTRAAYRADEEA